MPFLKIHQYICDHDSFVTAKKVYNRYAGFSKECHTLMVLFREQIESYKEKIGKGKAESTYRGLVADYKSLLLFMKTKKNIEDIAIDELESQYPEMADVHRAGKGLVASPSFHILRVQAGIQEKVFSY